MQQVGRTSAAAAVIVEPASLRSLPSRRGRRRAFININRYWVLHRRILLRVIVALICALALAAGFNTRGGIMASVDKLSGMMQGEFANAGFGINEISISGQSVTSEAVIVMALEINERSSTLNFDVAAARERLMALPAIAEASVRRTYPAGLTIEVTESVPVARWRVDGQTYVIDSGGARLGNAIVADATLPLVIGEGAGDDAAVMVRALQRYPDISTGIVAISRIADRRWDLIYDSGLRVQLPEAGVAQALRELDGYQRDHQLLDRDITQIDMRVADMLAVRPTIVAEAEVKVGAN